MIGRQWVYILPTLDKEAKIHTRGTEGWIKLYSAYSSGLRPFAKYVLDLRTSIYTVAKS